MSEDNGTETSGNRMSGQNLSVKTEGSKNSAAGTLDSSCANVVLTCIT